eukprot:gene41239-biopygen27900
MRSVLMAGLMSMSALTAHAESSIEFVKRDVSADSIDYIRCTHCAPVKTKKQATPELVLRPGTQTFAFKELGGVLRVYRTEAWMGGSPVTYVSKANAGEIEQNRVAVAAAAAQKSQPIVVSKQTPGVEDTDMSGVTAKVILNTDAAAAANTPPKIAIDKGTTKKIRQ